MFLLCLFGAVFEVTHNAHILLCFAFLCSYTVILSLWKHIQELNFIINASSNLLAFSLNSGSSAKHFLSLHIRVKDLTLARRLDRH